MSKVIALEVNSEIKRLILSKNISVHDGVTYLICLYYGITPTFIPEELERRILSTGIITKDYSTDTVKWNVSLFEEQETDLS